MLSLDGVAPSRMVGVSASVNLPLHHEVHKFSSGTSSPGWSRKKGRKTAVVVAGAVVSEVDCPMFRLFHRCDACSSQPRRPALGSHQFTAQSRHRLRQFAAGHRRSIARPEQATCRRETPGMIHLDVSVSGKDIHQKKLVQFFRFLP